MKAKLLQARVYQYWVSNSIGTKREEILTKKPANIDRHCCLNVSYFSMLCLFISFYILSRVFVFIVYPVICGVLKYVEHFYALRRIGGNRRKMRTFTACELYPYAYKKVRIIFISRSLFTQS